jgi:DNA-binding PadR family transcriptional regulator
MFFSFSDPKCHGAGRGGWGWAFDPSGAFWGGRGRHRGGPFRGGRVFEQGDLKYVILQLLAEKPRHGYEIIKELEDRFGGSYAPSAGTVYPTLTLLEDLGYASVTTEESGKKVYSITEEGRKYLEENRGVVDDIFERIANIGASFLSDAMMDVNRSFGRLARATYATAPWHSRDKHIALRLREILDDATRRIEELAKTAPTQPPSGSGESDQKP